MNGPFLLYYLLVKNNEFEEKVNFYKNLLVKFAKKNFGVIASKFVGAVYSFTEAVVVVLFIQRFFIGHFMVPTPSMVPEIVPGDHFIVDMVTSKFIEPSRGRVYIFDSTVSVHSRQDRWCKRLMGLPGDELKIENDSLYVNGNLVEDRRYTQGNMDRVWKVPKKGDKLSLQGALFEYMGEIKDLQEMRELQLRTIDDVEVVNRGKFILNGEETGPILDKDVYLDLVNNEEIELEEDFLFFLGDNTEGSHDSRYVGFINRSRIEGGLIFRIWPLNRVGF